MRYLFVSLDGLISDIAWEVVKEGHDVKYYIHDPGEKEIADGFVPKTDDWEREVSWADLIVFDDVLGQGAHAQRLRQAGKLVVGGTPYTDRLEDDRAFGQQELKRQGSPSSRRRTSRHSTMPSRYVQANPEPLRHQAERRSPKLQAPSVRRRGRGRPRRHPGARGL